jgi:hypothetical protein
VHSTHDKVPTYEQEKSLYTLFGQLGSHTENCVSLTPGFAGLFKLLKMNSKFLLEINASYLLFFVFFLRSYVLYLLENRISYHFVSSLYLFISSSSLPAARFRPPRDMTFTLLFYFIHLGQRTHNIQKLNAETNGIRNT